MPNRLSRNRDLFAADLFVTGEDRIAVRVSKVERAFSLKVFLVLTELEGELKRHGAEERIVTRMHDDLNEFDRKLLTACFAPYAVAAASKELVLGKCARWSRNQLRTVCLGQRPLLIDRHQTWKCGKL